MTELVHSTQLEAARAGVVTPEMVRVAIREATRPEVVREEVARGRLVIPANKRHLAGSSGDTSTCADASLTASGLPFHGLPYPSVAAGHPGAGEQDRLWVNQTVTQRAAELADDSFLIGQRAPKRLDPMGIGRAVSTKINANIGASPVSSSTAEEVEKLRWAQRYGADTVMDLSTGGDLRACRQAILDHSTVPIGTVPIYSMIQGRSIEELTYDDILREIEAQARQGVDYFTIHAGLLREHLALVAPRVTGIVSRGGSLLAKWMIHHGRQNPMYEIFDEISSIMREYDVTYSLGDGLRPGCLADASDPAQLAELRVLGELVQRAREAGVQVMVEGPGHVPLNEVAANIEMERRICDDAPFYVLGPLVTDAFPGYDHITSAIGATEAARAGAAMLCYVTPKEHVGLPKPEDVKAGCVAYKIAAHAGDLARGMPGARYWDDDLSRARAALNWPKQFELAFDGETARAFHDADLPVDTDFCAMCGHDWCSMRISKEIEAFASGKDDEFQPARRAARSPAAPRNDLAQLGRRGDKAACHSDHVPDADAARLLQRSVRAGAPEVTASR